ncbi:TetR/AcrR family transcriptional regulator [Phenylobacterium sp.]|uniref:TetR/AcrR family transcriptional regulator n=1 Tax=Phenylobacterium sp. TaxID=1871053 RepID=UPI002897A357|nr:TetR/AcrR family transcriptional regulator [Phenylobacterium sp.]
MSNSSQLPTRIRSLRTLARRPLTNPRKNASQARSRATVDALVEATARILVREGFERASTNRIAAQAGVSIGSLYQYFPGKEALVAAVIARHNRDLMRVTGDALAQVAAAPIETGVRTLVAAAIEAHRIDPQLHRVLAEQTPRTGALADVELFHREAHGLFRGYLEDHRDELGDLDLDLAAFVCVTSIEALTHTAVIHRADILAGDAVATLVDEAARLVIGYLRPRAVA